MYNNPPGSGTNLLRSNTLADDTSGCFHRRKEEPYALIEGGSGFRRALKRAPDRWRVFVPPCSLRVTGE